MTLWNSPEITVAATARSAPSLRNHSVVNWVTSIFGVQIIDSRSAAVDTNIWQNKIDDRPNCGVCIPKFLSA
jgi:hypothetical protein